MPAAELTRLIEIDDDRRIAHVRVGDLHIKSLWIVGIAAGRPRISWPETAKGYPIISAEPALQAEIDALILAAVGGKTSTEDQPLLKAMRPKKKRRKPAPTRPQAPAEVSRTGAAIRHSAREPT